MTWIYRLKSSFFNALAESRRRKLRRHMTEALSRLDDRSLALIGISRCQIEKHARTVAQRAVPISPMPVSNRYSPMMRLRSWRDRQVAIRELSRLDDRLLRDIGIEPDLITDVVDAMLRRRRDNRAIEPVNHSSESAHEVLTPNSQDSRGPTIVTSTSSPPLHNGAAPPPMQSGRPRSAHIAHELQANTDSSLRRRAPACW
jgi:uncharacterized protein YjiS (DUF1127 family)